MKIFSGFDIGLKLDISLYVFVGYHATSSLAAKSIETEGFLPGKIFTDHEHNCVLREASNLNIDASDYIEWLKMKSVTFTPEFEMALMHGRSGSAGGHGLTMMRNVLNKIIAAGNVSQKTLALNFQEIIENILTSPQVVYVVDLDGLEPRLVKDHSLYQYYWNPLKMLPKQSEISPSRLIARIDIQSN